MAVPDPETAGRALGANAEAFARGVPGGWVLGPPQARAFFTGLPAPTMNGVCALGQTATPEVIARSVDRVRAERVPFSLLARPGAASSAQAVAEAEGLTGTGEAIPLMAIAAPPPEPDLPALHLRDLAPAELALHGRIASRAFGVPADIFNTVSEAALRLPGTRLYLGEVDGEPVTTSLSVSVGGAVSVFNVATPPEHRGHGYGTAVTVRAVRAGFAAGARFVWLQSSLEAEPMYERLGFRTIEPWSCWISG